MAQVTIICGDAYEHGRSCGLIMTDPPYDMSGAELARIIGAFSTQHLVMLTTMRQLLEFMPLTNWQLNFDFVWDGVMPKKSKSYMQPNYLHQTGVYMTKPGVKSAFDRRRRQRSDVFEGNGYWPTIFRAPRDNVQEHGHAKNAQALTDLLGSFDVPNVCDPFAGSGSLAVAAWDLDLPCTLIERDRDSFNRIKNIARFMGAYGLEVIE